MMCQDNSIQVTYYQSFMYYNVMYSIENIINIEMCPHSVGHLFMTNLIGKKNVDVEPIRVGTSSWDPP